MIKNYRFYLFDDIPLVLETMVGVEHTIVPDMYICEIDRIMFGYIEYLNDLSKEKDICIITALWNTGKCAVVELHGCSSVKVKN